MKNKTFKYLFLAILMVLFVLCFSKPKVGAVEKVEGTTYYIAPNGLSTNDGKTKETARDFYTGLDNARIGDTIICMPGTYDCPRRITLSQSGNAFSYITVKAYDENRVVFDFSKMLFDSTNRGIQIDADYWHFYGIDVKGAGDNGMYIAGNHNIIEYCEFYDNRDSGLQLGRGSSNDTTVRSWPSYNYIKNCTSYNNYDDETYGENADGFAAKLTIGYGNVFDGCIAYRNSDDGWDLYAKSDTGNVGTVIIMNCAAFENGWLLDGSTTRDGDGIGFKLGGSNMEGDVVCINCMAWNNRLHGFSDNSNPRTMIVRNCTAYNNSVSVINGLPGYSDGGSTNFNLARNNQSYNAYYGLLSYCTNCTADNIDYEVGDDFLGSTAYSIFHTSKGVYHAITECIDGSSYEQSKIGTTYSGLKDSCFASVEFGYEVSDYANLHKLLRNSDESINMGTMLDIVDEKLLTFANGSQIGCKLNKSSWDEYDHFEYTKPTLGMTEDEIELLAAKDALILMCNEECVFQDFPIIVTLNDVKISWKSSDEELFSFGTTVFSSFSLVNYVTGTVHRSSYGDRNVTLTATLTLGDAVDTKEFNITLKKDNPRLGEIVGVDPVYIVDLYSNFTEPNVNVTNLSSYSGQYLKKDIDYGLKVEYEYAKTNTSTRHKVSKVYTAVPGVYYVTYTAKSYNDKNDTLSKTFMVYVVSPTLPIDFKNTEDSYEFYVCRDGVHIIGELTNVSGHLHAYLSENPNETVESVIENGIDFKITSDTFDELVPNDNDGEYYIHVVVENNAKTVQSVVYTKKVTVVEIATQQDFYNLVNSGTSSVVIYLLTNDIDFTDFTWNASSNTDAFKGLLNGDGHTVKNITIQSNSKNNNNIIYRLSGGTVMNINFDNIKLLGSTDTSTRVAIIGQMLGGYVHNIKMTNITSTGYQSVGGLVGQITGRDNYVTQISLINPYEFDDDYKLKEGYPYFTVTTKYCGGIIANIQKDTAEDYITVSISDCYADAYVGTGTDSGGYIGGIVGRIKNDLDCYSVSIKHCMFDGVTECLKNYTGGIIGGCESGAGVINVTYNVSRPVIIFGNTRSIIDGVTMDKYGQIGIAVKTGSPILGRYTAGTGTYIFINNFATFGDYNSAVGSIAGEEDLNTLDPYKFVIGFDMDIWEWCEETQGIRLK